VNPREVLGRALILSGIFNANLLYLNSFIRVRKQSPVLGIAFPKDWLMVSAERWLLDRWKLNEFKRIGSIVSNGPH
jgi:hypothetical protein